MLVENSIDRVIPLTRSDVVLILHSQNGLPDPSAQSGLNKFTIHRDCKDGTRKLSRLDGELVPQNNYYLTVEDIKMLYQLDNDNYSSTRLK